MIKIDVKSQRQQTFWDGESIFFLQKLIFINECEAEHIK
jgi:hypothetical protein